MLITLSYQEFEHRPVTVVQSRRTLLHNNHDNPWNYTICKEFCWKWRKHYRKVAGSLRRRRRAARGFPPAAARMQIKRNQNNNLEGMVELSWPWLAVPSAAQPHLSLWPPLAPWRQKGKASPAACLTGWNANRSRPIPFYYSYCLNCNYVADSALMRKITISGQKHFSSDYR